ncbi:MAG TPA: oligopeptide transporter, OPT family [Terriglobia bacterium]|jgi:putative OPT family oligopeptide transporter
MSSDVGGINGIPVGKENLDRVGIVNENAHLAGFRPFIPAEAHLRELGILPLIMGTILGVVFGASSLYLVLKVGLTVSASIPVAVISITIFRVLSKLGLRDATILENNIVQTAGSAGESIAFGIGVTMPAILILGFDLELTRVMLVAILGGLLGILMMIPLRRALIVAQHGVLKYPEGTACAEVLKAGASAESRAAAAEGARHTGIIDEATTGGKTIMAGFGIGFLYYGIQEIWKTWKEYPTKVFGKPFEAASISIENNPALLGVGYIIGPRISCIMTAGGVLSYLVLIPAIKFFGSGWNIPLAPETAHLIKDMSVSQIQKAYVLYIGAGAVAAGGIISLIRSLPVIWSGLMGGLADLRRTRSAAAAGAPRTDHDLSMKFVLGGIIALLLAIMIAPQLNLRGNLVGALLIVAFGFLFVTVSSRLTGEIGSSSNPISGMTVATLLLTCLVFLIIGWTAPPYFVTALSIGGIVCIAASNGGTTSQDLKTGFLVGSTPKFQQIAILVGALASAVVLGPILLAMNQSGTVYVPVSQNRDFTFPAGFHFNPDQYLKNGDQPKRDTVKGSQARADGNSYYVVHKTTPEYGPSGRYLVNDQGVPVYLADPGINGIYDKLPGSNQSVPKFTAPKATLMSYIIKGILSGELPWGLVLLGVMTSVVLELSGIPSLAFAVGMYLPLSTSTPIFVGGMVRWGVDRYLRKKPENLALTEEEMAAKTDQSPGVLLASGYIAGATLAGVIYSFLNLSEGVTVRLNGFEDWATKNNPFFEGRYSDLLGLVPLVILTVVLYIVGRELLLKPKPYVQGTQ